jgi:signal peptidase I
VSTGVTTQPPASQVADADARPMAGSVTSARGRHAKSSGKAVPALARVVSRGWRFTAGTSLVGVVVALGALVLAPAFGYRDLIVRSGSMGATAPVGSLVINRPVAGSSVKVGDIILIERRAGSGTALAPVLHRVIARSVSPAGVVVVTTKGDANRTADPESYTLPAKTSTPIVIIPRLGYLLTAVRQPVTWLFVFGVVALIGAAAFLLRSVAKGAVDGRR